jgi:hypothetical protein
MKFGLNFGYAPNFIREKGVTEYIDEESIGDKI